MTQLRSPAAHGAFTSAAIAEYEGLDGSRDRPWRWVVGLVLVLVLLGVGCRGEEPGGDAPSGGLVPPVTTLGACAASPAQWAERCARRTDIQVRVEGCADGVAVFALAVPPETGHTQLRVEVKPSTEPGLRNVGPFRIVPIGQFGDWASEPEGLRVPFDQLVSCVESDLGLELEVPEPHEGSGSSTTSEQRAPRADTERPTGFLGRVDYGPPPVPWRLFGGLGFLALAAALAVRRRHALDVLVAVSVLVVTLALRARVFPEAHFHQNGQGPLWVEFALGLVGTYGPGFREVFGIWVSRAGDPDGALFAVQGVFAASGVAALYLALRAVGSTRAVAAVLALACVLDPALGRLARGESYFAIWASLIALATAGVAGGCATWVSGASIAGDGVGLRRFAWAREPRLVAALGILGAGLLIAQGARIHPVGWPAAAIVPFAVLTLRGPWWRRVACAAVVGAGIGAVVAATSLPAMLDVLSGGLGSKWMPAVGGEHHDIPVDELVGAFLATLVLGAIGGELARRGRTVAGRVFDAAALVAMISLVVTIHDATNLLAGTKPHVVWGNAMMYVWVPLVAVGAAATRLLPRGATASVVVVILVTGTAGLLAESRWEDVTTLPTDAREASLVRQWRQDLSPGAVLYYVERAQRYVARIPVYGVAGGTRRQTVDPGAAVEHVVSPGPGRYWYRSSICSATVAEDVCADVERTFVLEPIHEAELPARPSMEGNDYAHVPVRIGLYRVVSVRGEGAPAPLGP